MIEVYSLDAVVTALTAVPLNSVALKKGNTVELTGTSSLQFNKCGVYMLSCTASTSASTTIQLYKNDIAQPQAQSTGTTTSFTTLVQVPENNTNCPCSVPTICEIVSTDAVTFNSIDVVVTKVI